MSTNIPDCGIGYIELPTHKACRLHRRAHGRKQVMTNPLEHPVETQEPSRTILAAQDVFRESLQNMQRHRLMAAMAYRKAQERPPARNNGTRDWIEAANV
jgi:hypothetical protein